MGQLEKPTRDGYRLKGWAEDAYQDWKDLGGCNCPFTIPPCSSCTHEGHPLSLENEEEAWEPQLFWPRIEKSYKEVKEEEEMSRDKIVNKTADPPVSVKTDPPKEVNAASQWFGYKYKVNPETSRLLQEAVFKDGGEWIIGDTVVQFTDIPYLFVSKGGRITNSGNREHFEQHPSPEKQPPQACNLYEANNTWVGIERPVKEYRAFVQFDNYYKTYSYRLSEDIYNQIHGKRGVKLNVEVFDKHLNRDIIKQVNLVAISHNKDINATKWIHSVYEEPKRSILDTVVKVEISSITNPAELVKAVQEQFLNNQQEEINMTQARKVYNFKLIDSDPALPVDQALVHDFGDVVVEDDIETVKQQLLGDNDLKAILAKHNKKRVENVNLTIQQNTGNTVKLLPLTKVKELTWSVK